MFYAFVLAFFTHLISILFSNPITLIIATLTFLTLSCFTVLGFIFSPILIYKIIKNKPLGRYTSSLPGITVGFLIVILGVNPLLANWEDDQRNLSGKAIASLIQEYKNDKNEFPNSLQDLKIDKLKNEIHFPFTLSRFRYTKTNDSFELLTGANLFDSYIWNSKEQEFEYQDF